MRDDDPDDIDYPYYVTAHELAHQWWGHQVPGADVQGETMLVETLAQYSALMVMKQKYGDAKMRRFLRYELDRYLIGRSGEQKKELPLSRVENQHYIHYRKGSLIMYALADYIGEANLNRAIRAYRDEWAFKGPPFSSTTHLIAQIREVTPPDLQYVIDDFFDTITLYDNRAQSASGKGAAGRPLRGDAEGSGQEAQGRRARQGRRGAAPRLDRHRRARRRRRAVVPRKRRIDREQTSFTVVVGKRPARAGIDPYNKLIDRSPKDNTVAVTVE